MPRSNLTSIFFRLIKVSFNYEIYSSGSQTVLGYCSCGTLATFLASPSLTHHQSIDHILQQIQNNFISQTKLNPINLFALYQEKHGTKQKFLWRFWCCNISLARFLLFIFILYSFFFLWSLLVSHFSPLHGLSTFLQGFLIYPLSLRGQYHPLWEPLIYSTWYIFLVF